MTQQRDWSRRPVRIGRALGVVVLACGLLSSAACSHGYGCTKVGGLSTIAVTVDAGMRARLASLRLELCQEHHCANVTFPAKSPSRYGIYIEKGVALDKNTYVVGLRTFGHGWDANAASTLTVEGRSGADATVLHHTESFKFTKYYPNGKRCDRTPDLAHHTEVDRHDLAENPT